MKKDANHQEVETLRLANAMLREKLREKEKELRTLEMDLMCDRARANVAEDLFRAERARNRRLSRPLSVQSAAEMAFIILMFVAGCLAADALRALWG